VRPPRPGAALPGLCRAFRRSELRALEVADLTEIPDGLQILIRRSKNDQEGQGQEVAISQGYRLRPVEGGADMARRGGDQQRSGVPGSGPRRAGLSALHAAGWAGQARLAGVPIATDIPAC
jgi:hypothetical protein